MAEINATIESSISESRVSKIFTNKVFEEKKFAKNNGIPVLNNFGWQ